jgi:peptidoglycan/LPS O-acetylase OafA/YrhL
LEHSLTDSLSQATENSADGSVTSRAPNRSYFPALDGLRAVAFLMVFGQHYLGIPWGWAGVDIFFVLSGFLITGILYDTCEQPHRVRNFYIRRTLRIFPLYYGVMILLVLSYPYFRWRWNWTWLAWPAYVGNFCRGIYPYASHSGLQMLADFQPLSATRPGLQLFFGHFWSLCVEEQFYLVWPWMVFWIRDRRKLMQVCLACVVICPVLRIVGSHTLPQFSLDQEILYRWTPFRVDALLLGGLIALVRRGPSGQRNLLAVARPVFCVLATMFVCYLGYGFRHRHAGLTHPRWAFTWGLLLVDLVSASLIVMALETGSVAYQVLKLRPLRWLGRISYGAYVFHDIFHGGIESVVRRYTSDVKSGTAAVALVFTLLLSWVSYRWYETPFIRLKERWTRAPATLQQRDGMDALPN